MFASPRTGDVLLVAGDDEKRAHFFPLSLLSSLSSFFATLPPPSAQDLLGDTPVIPLYDTTSRGLTLCLLAVKSVLRAETLSDAEVDGDIDAVVDAAVIARIYQIPAVFKELDAAVQGADTAHVFARYAIWVLAGVPSRVDKAAKATTTKDLSIHDASRHLAETIKRHVPLEWMRLLDLHLRRIHAMPRFYLGIESHEENHPFFFHGSSETCSDGCSRPEETVRSLLLQARTVEEIAEVAGKGYGLDCEACEEEARNFYGPSVEERETFAGTY